jgi:hypothetical protein
MCLFSADAVFKASSKEEANWIPSGAFLAHETKRTAAKNRTAAKHASLFIRTSPAKS